ncbi:MAG TPA: hypothetical protein VGH28_10865 [Polyangiaceae bacterium]|jgi:hypothetical protein
MDPSRFTFDYFDVSDDRAAWAATEPHEDRTHALIHAGFKPLGCAMAKLRVGRRVLLEQVWIAHGGRVMAGVGGGIELATLFEDGTIVKTSQPFRWAFVHTTWWHLRKHPAARHFHETFAAHAEDLLARQESRVKDVEARGGVVVPATSMKAHFAMRFRAADLRIALQLVEVHVIGIATLILSLLAGVAAVWARLATHGRHGRMEHPLLLLLGLAATIIAILPTTWLARMGAAICMPWFFRGPPPQPASELLARAESVPAGRVPSDF